MCKTDGQKLPQRGLDCLPAPQVSYWRSDQVQRHQNVSCKTLELETESVLSTMTKRSRGLMIRWKIPQTCNTFYYQSIGQEGGGGLLLVLMVLCVGLDGLGAKMILLVWVTISLKFVLVCPSCREKRINNENKKKETPCHKGMGPQLAIKNENNHWWYLKGKDDWMKIWYMQVEEKTQTHSKMCKPLRWYSQTYLKIAQNSHEAINANLLKDCANLNRIFCKLE